MNLVQREANTYKLEGAAILRVMQALPDFDARLAFAYELIEKLAPEETAAA